jgi:hypothetical protein
MQRIKTVKKKTTVGRRMTIIRWNGVEGRMVLSMTSTLQL